VKHALAATTCAALLLGSLTACGTSDSKSTLPAYTDASTPSATTTRPATTATTATATATGPVVPPPHATYRFGGLNVIVNLPANIPGESRANMMVLSEFLQADARTTAESRLDPSLAALASADILKETKAQIAVGSDHGVGSVTYTISSYHTAGGLTTLATGCLDQSKVVQVRKDGSHFVDVNTKKYPTLTMSATISRGMAVPKVTRFTVTVKSC
jgi:hypothetical protein